jgi:hypothetical protein
MEIQVHTTLHVPHPGGQRAAVGKHNLVELRAKHGMHAPGRGECPPLFLVVCIYERHSPSESGAGQKKKKKKRRQGVSQLDTNHMLTQWLGQAE